MKSPKEIKDRITRLEGEFRNIVKEIDRLPVGERRSGLAEEGQANITRRNTLLWVLLDK